MSISPTRRTARSGRSPASKAAAAALAPSLKQAVLYARVSSREQEREGFSIPAQQAILKKYAADNGFAILEEFIDVETAKKTGRVAFTRLLQMLKKKAGKAPVVLVEKTDRLYRNLKDWVALDEMKVDIHFVKEGIVLSDESRSSEKFIHGIKVLMAKNYVDNLSEEVRKGLREKAEQGIWPGPAPFGYINVARGDGKRIIEVDPVRGPFAKRMFDLYVTGRYSINDLVKEANKAGMVSWKTKRPLHVSAIHLMLKNPLYKGEYKWLGTWIQGSHQRIVSPEMWARAQDIMAGRGASAPIRHEFAFNGLIHCGVCAEEGDRRLLVGEIKKGKYTYYHCCGCQRNGRRPPFVKEAAVTAMFAMALQELSLHPLVLSWLKAGLKDSHTEEKRCHAEAVAKIEKKATILKRRLDVLYEDRLDGRITVDDYTERSNAWREELAHLRESVSQLDRADAAYLDSGIALLELAATGVDLYESQNAEERRRLLNFLCSNSEFRGDTIKVTWRKPFDGLAQSIAEADPEKTRIPDFSAGDSRWRSGRDSNPRPPA